MSRDSTRNRAREEKRSCCSASGTGRAGAAGLVGVAVAIAVVKEFVPFEVDAALTIAVAAPAAPAAPASSIMHRVNIVTAVLCPQAGPLLGQ